MDSCLIQFASLMYYWKLNGSMTNRVVHGKRTITCYSLLIINWLLSFNGGCSIQVFPFSVIPTLHVIQIVYIHICWHLVLITLLYQQDIDYVSVYQRVSRFSAWGWQ